MSRPTAVAAPAAEPFDELFAYIDKLTSVQVLELIITMYQHWVERTFLTGTVDIRSTHRYAFRSGDWATIVAVEWANDRPCYRIRFPDNVFDSWPVHDPSDTREFRAHQS